MGRGRKKQLKMADPLVSLGNLTNSLENDPFSKFMNSSRIILPPCDLCNTKFDTQLCSGCQLTAYCSKEHQTSAWPMHRSECKASRKNRAKHAFKLEMDSASPTGRLCRAERDIEQGEILLEELPLFHFSPPSRVPARPLGQCVTCGLEVKPIDQNSNRNDALTRCPICNWPCCSRACAEARIHAKHECRIFKLNEIKYPELVETGPVTGSNDNEDVDDGKKPNKEQDKRSRKVIMEVLVARGFSVWVQERESTWKRISNSLPGFQQRMLEDSNFLALMSKETKYKKEWNFSDPLNTSIKYRAKRGELERSFPIMPKPDDVRMKILMNMMITKFDMIFPQFLCFRVTPTSQRHITNKSDISRKFIYEVATHFKHACLPNCHWSIGPAPDFKIRVRAAIRIRKSTILSLSRASLPFYDTQTRQQLMFKPPSVCMCALCTDPTENRSFQAALSCPNCLKEARGSESGSEVDLEQFEGYIIPCRLEAKTKAEKFALPLSKENFIKMVKQEAQRWVCFKCDEFCDPTKLIKENPKFSNLVSEINSLIKTTTTTKTAEKRTQKEASVKKEEQLLDKFEDVSVKSLFYQTHYVIQHAAKEYKCPVIPNFPDYPHYSNVPEVLESLSISDGSVSADILVENHYVSAIQRHAFLIQILDRTFPGLQDERIELVEKLGIALLDQCKRHISPDLIDLEAENTLVKVNVHDLSKKCKFWAVTSGLCRKLLEESLLFYQGVWPSQNYNVEERISSLQEKIQAAQKFQNFQQKYLKLDETSLSCTCHHLDVLICNQVLYLLLSSPVETNFTNQDEDLALEGKSRIFTHFRDCDLFQQKINEVGKLKVLSKPSNLNEKQLERSKSIQFKSSLVSKTCTDTVDQISDKINLSLSNELENHDRGKSVLEMSTNVAQVLKNNVEELPEEKEPRSKISNKALKLKTSVKTSVTESAATAICNKLENSKSSFPDSSNQTVITDGTKSNLKADKKFSKTVEIFEMPNLAAISSSSVKRSDDTAPCTVLGEKSKNSKNLLENDESILDIFEEDSSNVTVLADTNDPSKPKPEPELKLTDDSGTSSTPEENSLFTTENLRAEEGISNEDLSDFLHNYMTKSEKNVKFVKNILSPSKSKEPIPMMLKQLGFDQNLLNESQKRIKTHQQAETFEENPPDVNTDEIYFNFVQQNNTGCDNFAEISNLFSPRISRWEISPDPTKFSIALPHPPKEVPTKVLNSVPKHLQESRKKLPSFIPKLLEKSSQEISKRIPNHVQSFDIKTLNSVPKRSTESSKERLNSIPKLSTKFSEQTLDSVPKSFTEVSKQSLESVQKYAATSVLKSKDLASKTRKASATKPPNSIEKPQRTSQISGQTKLTVKSENSADFRKRDPLPQNDQNRHWDLFITRLPAQAEPSDIISYLAAQGRSEIFVEKIPPSYKNPNRNQQPHQKYSSFRVKFGAPLDVQAGDACFWPAGSLVRRWHNSQPRNVEQHQRQSEGQVDNSNSNFSSKVSDAKHNRKMSHRSAAPSSNSNEAEAQTSCQLPNVQNDNLPTIQNSASQRLCIVC